MLMYNNQWGKKEEGRLGCLNEAQAAGGYCRSELTSVA